MVQTSEQYEFVHHALCLYESRLSAETVQWFSEDLPDHQSPGVINQLPTWGFWKELPAMERKEKPWSQAVARIVEGGNTIKDWQPLVYMNVFVSIP